MATRLATVLTSNVNELTLIASRQGGCQACAQKTSCAIQWQPNSAETHLRLTAQTSSLNTGDTVEVSCDERFLLSYLLRLFLPTLSFLLICSMVVEVIDVQLNLITTVFYQGITPLFVGSLTSRAWLKSLQLLDLKITKPTSSAS